jgi:hypothetical protein
VAARQTVLLFTATRDDGYSASGVYLIASAAAELVSVPDIVSLPHPALSIGKQEPTDIPSVYRTVSHASIIRGRTCKLTCDP